MSFIEFTYNHSVHSTDYLLFEIFYGFNLNIIRFDYFTY